LIVQDILLDYETYSEIDLVKCGADVYSKHPSTDIICLSWGELGGEPEDLWWPSWQPVPEKLAQAIRDGARLHAFNARFERLITANIAGPRYMMPGPKLDQWHCSEAHAKVNGMGGKLELLGPVMGLSEQKDSEGHRVMLQISKPRKPSKNDPSTRWNDPEKTARVGKYCIQDWRTENALIKALPPFPPAERKVWLFDQYINDRGIQVDVEAVAAASELVEKALKEACARLDTLTGGEVTTPNQVAKILEFVRQNSEKSIEDLTAWSVENYLKDCDPENPASQVLQIRQDVGRTSVKKLAPLQVAIGHDGVMRGMLQYCGAASTGRWAGRLFQPHNIPRGDLSQLDMDTLIRLIKAKDDFTLRLAFNGSVMAAVVQSLRGMLIPRSRRIMGAGDYSGIELVITMWLAGDTLALEKIRKGIDLYIEMAKKIYQRDDIVKKDPERQTGKATVLGCGFGLGGSTFKTQAEQTYGVVVSEEMAQTCVTMYREEYPLVKRAWYGLDEAFMYALTHPGKEGTYGKVSYRLEGDWMVCRIPSGRELRYYKPKVRMEEMPWSTEEKPDIRPRPIYLAFKEGRWQEIRGYGGLFFENVVQALARDVIVSGMMSLEQMAHFMLLSVHDEAVVEGAPHNVTEKSIVDIMEGSKPLWLGDAPLRVEAWTGERYRK
jgi:DNA polymerase